MGHASRKCTRIAFFERLGKRATQAIIFCVLCTILHCRAQAEERVLPPLVPSVPVSHDPAHPTPAWLEFCERLSGECVVDQSEPETIPLGHKTWETLVDVNRFVNTIITPVTDQKHWGIEDRWDFPEDGKGDCEDIQLLKRRMLIEAGLPRRALRMTVVLDELRTGHAVLMVRTHQGDFILDNKTNAVLLWSATGYEFLKREGALGRRWDALSPTRPQSLRLTGDRLCYSRSTWAASPRVMAWLLSAIQPGLVRCNHRRIGG